jgi:hypothetical protein
MQKSLSFTRFGWLPVTVGVATGVFLVVSLVQAVTTISTDITTEGALTVSGASALSSTLTVTGKTTLGSATSTSLTTTSLYFATASSTGLASVDSLKVASTGDTVSEIQFGTCTVTIGSITASTTAMATCTATGVTTAFQVFVRPYITDNGIVMVSASSTANDTIQIAVHNIGYTGAVNPADNVWGWMAVR